MIVGTCHCEAVQWRLDASPNDATACNCTICRRYSALWAYGYENDGVSVSGETRFYVRGDWIEFHFCPVCSCVMFWRAQRNDEQGRRRIGVNLRMAEPDAVARVPIDRVDGIHNFDHLPRDGRCVADYGP